MNARHTNVSNSLHAQEVGSKRPAGAAEEPLKKGRRAEGAIGEQSTPAAMASKVTSKIKLKRGKGDRTKDNSDVWHGYQIQSFQDILGGDPACKGRGTRTC